MDRKVGIFVFVLAASAPIRADDWPCWRGPARNGISAEKDWLDQWPADGPRVAWKAEVGTGFSTFAVAKVPPPYDERFARCLESAAKTHLRLSISRSARVSMARTEMVVGVP